MKQHHCPRLILRAGGFQTENVKNHIDYRKVSRFEQKQGVMYSTHARHVGSQVNQRGLL